MGKIKQFFLINDNRQIWGRKFFGKVRPYIFLPSDFPFSKTDSFRNDLKDSDWLSVLISYFSEGHESR